MSYERYPSGFRIEPTLRPHIAPIPVSNRETSEGRSPVTIGLSKPRHAPNLISAELYSRQSYFLPHNIPSYVPKSYSGSGSSDSRFSDHSDDSKCSPASSPNLIWKRRPSSPLIGQYDNRIEWLNRSKMNDLSEIESKRYHRNEVTQHEYKSMEHRASPELQLRDVRSLNTNRDMNRDVYVGANMLMNLRHQQLSPVSQSEYISKISRKRHMNESLHTSPSKKINSPIEKKLHNFNISFLLGLEDKSRDDLEDRKEQDVDVCNLDDEEKICSYRDIFYKMSANLDKTFHKTMSGSKKFNL